MNDLKFTDAAPEEGKKTSTTVKVRQTAHIWLHMKESAPTTPSQAFQTQVRMNKDSLMATDQMASFQSTYKSTLRIEVPVWPDVQQALLPTNKAKCQSGRPETTPSPLPDRSHNQEAAQNPHALNRMSTEPPGPRNADEEEEDEEEDTDVSPEGQDASPSGKASCSEPRTPTLHGALATSMKSFLNGSSLALQ